MTMIPNEFDAYAKSPWTDGQFPHSQCGRYVQEHRLAYKRNPSDGTAVSYWECPL